MPIEFELGRLGCPGPVPSLSTIYRVLVRHGLVDALPRRRRRQDYRRRRREVPMELWQLDIVGGIQLANGTEAKVVTGVDGGQCRRVSIDRGSAPTPSRCRVGDPLPENCPMRLVYAAVLMLTVLAFGAPAAADGPVLWTGTPHVSGEMNSAMNLVLLDFWSGWDTYAEPITVQVDCYLIDGQGQHVSPGLRVRWPSGEVPVTGGRFTFSVAGNTSSVQNLQDFRLWRVSFHLIFDYRTTWQGNWTFKVKATDVSPANAVNEGTPAKTLHVGFGLDPNAPPPATTAPPTQKKPTPAPTSISPLPSASGVSESPSVSDSPSAAQEPVKQAAALAEAPIRRSSSLPLYAGVTIGVMILTAGSYVIHRRRRAGRS